MAEVTDIGSRPTRGAMRAPNKSARWMSRAIWRPGLLRQSAGVAVVVKFHRLQPQGILHPQALELCTECSEWWSMALACSALKGGALQGQIVLQLGHGNVHAERCFAQGLHLGLGPGAAFPHAPPAW